MKVLELDEEKSMYVNRLHRPGYEYRDPASECWVYRQFRNVTLLPDAAYWRGHTVYCRRQTVLQGVWGC